MRFHKPIGVMLLEPEAEGLITDGAIAIYGPQG